MEQFLEEKEFELEEVGMVMQTETRRGLGFRHLHSFNQAMLAKQLWRFIDNPDSLCAAVFKARYFLNGNVLSVEMGKGDSYVWRTLMSAKSILSEELCWRIRKGDKVMIMNDNWIEGSYCARPLSTKKSHSLVYVSSLIIEEERKWKTGLIKELFNKDTAQAILKLPLPGIPKEDSFFWKFDKFGKYNVKSDYQCVL